MHGTLGWDLRAQGWALWAWVNLSRFVDVKTSRRHEGNGTEMPHTPDQYAWYYSWKGMFNSFRHRTGACCKDPNEHGKIVPRMRSKTTGLHLPKLYVPFVR